MQGQYESNEPIHQSCTEMKNITVVSEYGLSWHENCSRKNNLQ